MVGGNKEFLNKRYSTVLAIPHPEFHLVFGHLFVAGTDVGLVTSKHPGYACITYVGQHIQRPFGRFYECCPETP